VTRPARDGAPTDPKFKWSLQTLTDRLTQATQFAYADPDGSTGQDIRTTVTDAANHAAMTRMDSYRRPTQTTNAKAQTTKLTWDADHNVTRLEEPNAAATTWTYDPKTGYPLTVTDAQANAAGTAGTTLTYRTSPDGFTADLATKASPEGRTWTFTCDNAGNLTGVTDPKGTATATVGDYTTTYTYDGYGQLAAVTDANGRPTTYANYDVVGYPKTITDPLSKSTTFGYGARGNVTSATDANARTSTYRPYDVFGRPGPAKQPKDQAGRNPAVISALTADGSNISDWGKYTSGQFKSPSGPSRCTSI
jgi:YD repeat-containing protein